MKRHDTVSIVDLIRAIALAHDHPDTLKPWQVNKLTAWRERNSGGITVVYDPKGRRARQIARELENAA